MASRNHPDTHPQRSLTRAFLVSSLTIAPGERYDVVIDFDGILDRLVTLRDTMGRNAGFIAAAATQEKSA